MLLNECFGDHCQCDRALGLAAALQEAISDPLDLSGAVAILANATGVHDVCITFMQQREGDEARVLATASADESRRRGANSSVPASAGLHPIVVTREIDRMHRFVLAAKLISGDEAAGNAVERLQELCDHLARCIRVAMESLAYPSPLGLPYTNLTEREWAVLCGLNSDDGEKQLANRLALSPHTLHSHIKSIYRKLGVQGRLPLVRKLQRALRDYRSYALAQITVSV